MNTHVINGIDVTDPTRNFTAQEWENTLAPQIVHLLWKCAIAPADVAALEAEAADEAEAVGMTMVVDLSM